MDSPPVDNQTEFQTHPQLILTKRGERIVAIVKATFELPKGGSVLTLAPEDRARPIRHADEPWEDATIESIKFPSDISPEKLGTDVIVVATAHPPFGHSGGYYDAFVKVGPVQKILRIFGLRVWEARGAGLSSPRPATSLDLRYDFAWGGRDDSDPAKVKEEARNPIGRGVRSNLADLTHTVGPQIEDPNQLISSAKTYPAPAGIGAIGRSFSPRRETAGTYDEAWKEFRCPLPPVDLNEEFFQAAHPDLIARPHLKGGEECALLSLSSHGALQFRLPQIPLEITFITKGRSPEVFRPPIDLVLIDTASSNSESPTTIEVTWRASTRAPRRAKDTLVLVQERN